MDKGQANITAIHVCSGGVVYVERAGEWYRINQEGQTHSFAEVCNWTEDVWRLMHEKPPCIPVVPTRRMG